MMKHIFRGMLCAAKIVAMTGPVVGCGGDGRLEKTNTRMHYATPDQLTQQDVVLQEEQVSPALSTNAVTETEDVFAIRSAMVEQRHFALYKSYYALANAPDEQTGSVPPQRQVVFLEARDENGALACSPIAEKHSRTSLSTGE